MRLVVVSHALVQEASRARWRRLAERHPVDVTLLIPAVWRSRWFGGDRLWRPEPEEHSRYRVVPLRVSHTSQWGRYVFVSPDARLGVLQPDVIYVVQDEGTLILQQMILYRAIWAPRAKLLFFSWNNLGIATARRRDRWKWRRVCRAADAAVAGNREVARVLGSAGFPKRIVVQTEIGIDERQFVSDAEDRARMREELGLSASVIGFAGRLVAEKGVRDLVEALLGIGGPWELLIVGDGPLRREIEASFAARGHSHRLRVVGEQPLDLMPRYLRAMDALVLPSRTREHWKEQFGLVLAQAMASGVAVIGSDSGAIPEVIADAGLVFREGDVGALRTCLQQVICDGGVREEFARRGYARATRQYSATALAEESYALFQALS